MLVLEERPTVFSKFPVKCCVVGNDDIRVGDKTFERYGVDAVPGHHLVSDAGQACDFRRDGCRWLIEGLENARDANDLIAVRVAEFYHGHLDDFVLAGVKAGRLEVDDDRDFAVVTGRHGRRQPRDETTQNLVVARGFELMGTIFGVFILSVHGFYLVSVLRRHFSGANIPVIPMSGAGGVGRDKRRRIAHIDDALTVRSFGL